MNPLGHRILEILQASPDGHSTAFNVFNVLNRDGYNVTKHEFEEACKKLHDWSCIAYQPVQCSLIDIPIGSLDLLTMSPAVSPLSPDAELALSIEALGEASVDESLAIEETRCPVESETESVGASRVGKPSASRQPAHASVFAVPIVLIKAWHRARASSWFAGFPGFSFRS